jgi:hypothetical protein
MAPPVSKPTTTSGPRPPGPPPNGGPAKAAARSQPTGNHGLTVSSGMSHQGEKVLAYSVGGAGKSSLCASIADLGIRPLFIDVGDSTSHLDVKRVVPRDFAQMREVFHDDGLLAPYGAIVLDDLTAAEEYALDWVLTNIPHEKGSPITGIESFGWGKGYVHLFETSLLILNDLDRIARMGKHVLVTAHDTIETVNNPTGENFLQHQPRLRSNKNARFRERCLEWAYHALFIDYDISVTNDGKAKGSGTRTIYPMPMPTWWAKSRSLSRPIPYPKGDVTLWRQLLGIEA